MVEGPSIPTGSNSLNQLRRDRVEQRENGRTNPLPANEESDRFEPSDELAAREASQNDTANPLGVDPDGGGSGSGQRDPESTPISGSAEAGDAVAGVSQQIAFDASGASVAQGNLDQETVLSLIA